MASVTYPKVLAFKPETMISNMPRASKSTGARERRSQAKKKKYRSRAEKKTRRILERKSSEKEKRGLRMLIKNCVS